MADNHIFVTGATGFIGQSVMKRLLQNAYPVTALLLHGESEEPVKGATIVRGDITRPSSLSGLLEGHQTVIHIAGAVGYQSWKNCRMINRDGMHHIVNEAVVAGIKRFIHISSVSVYGRVSDVPIDEDFPLKKIGDPYGDTKIEAERILREAAKRNNLDITILRPTAIYGKGDIKFLPSLIRNLKSGKFRMIGDGNQTVDLVNVADVADSVLIVLENDRSIGKTYNIAQSGNPTWNEFLAFLSAELNLALTEKHIPYQVAYTASGLMELISVITRNPPRISRYAIRLVGKQYIYVTDRIRNELGFSPAIGLKEGIQECLSDIKQV